MKTGLFFAIKGFMKKIFSIFYLFFLMACQQEPLQEKRAHIVEREVLPNGNLMISYIYKTGNTTVIDRTETKNSVLAHDSITVIFSKLNPEKKHIKIH